MGGGHEDIGTGASDIQHRLGLPSFLAQSLDLKFVFLAKHKRMERFAWNHDYREGRDQLWDTSAAQELNGGFALRVTSRSMATGEMYACDSMERLWSSVECEMF